MISRAYTEKTSPTNCTATSEATATTIVTSPQIYLDGTPVMIEFETQSYGQADTSVVNRVVLFEGSEGVSPVPIGIMLATRSPGGASATGKCGWKLRRRHTPTAGFHTYSVRGWVSAASTFIIAGDTFGAGIDLPAYLSITSVQTDTKPFYDSVSSANGTGSWSWSHIPNVPDPKGILVAIVQNVASTDVISAVTYGGLPMTRLQIAQDAAGEPMATYLYWLGTSVPPGTQTVSVTVASGTDAKIGVAWSLSSPNDCFVAASGKQEGDAANPSVTLGTQSWFDGWVFNAIGSGQNAPASLSISTGMLLDTILGRDFGSQSAAFEAGPFTGASVASGWTATIEDVAMATAAIATTPIKHPRHVVRSDAKHRSYRR